MDCHQVRLVVRVFMVVETAVSILFPKKKNKTFADETVAGIILDVFWVIFGCSGAQMREESFILSCGYLLGTQKVSAKVSD